MLKRIVVVAGLISAIASGQNRIDIFRPQDVKWSQVGIARAPDGGFVVQACGSVTNTANNVTLTECSPNWPLTDSADVKAMQNLMDKIGTKALQKQFRVGDGGTL